MQNVDTDKGKISKVMKENVLKLQQYLQADFRPNQFPKKSLIWVQNLLILHE
jgi:hypothetical protein